MTVHEARKPNVLGDRKGERMLGSERIGEATTSGGEYSCVC